MTVQPSPFFQEHHEWVVEFMEETLEKNTESAEELRDRVRELRQKAARTDIKGFRDAWEMLATRYEALAASRPVSG